MAGENQVDTLVNKLAASRFLAVVGTSGSGKSSLVNCGLKPALRLGLMTKAGTAWRTVQFRPGNRPVRALARALASADGPFGSFRPEGLALDEIVEATLRMSKIGLVDVYEQADNGDRPNLLVVVDQFEELFRYRSSVAAFGPTEQQRAEEAAAFVNLLLEAKEQTEFPIYIVLTMRSDFLGDCAQFPGLPEAINESQYLVPRMTREERRAATAGPTGVEGAAISPVLLTRLVNDVGDNPDQLSILQHALNRTWAAWERDGEGSDELDLVHYEAIGTMAHALDQHAERAYAELTTDQERAICVKLFKSLTDKGTDPRGVRRPTRLDRLCAIAGASEAEVVQVIEVFRKPSRSFLMPPQPEPLDCHTVIDISHETLMRVWERLRKWADEEAESARLFRRLSDSAALHAEGRAGLWRDPELQFALEWRDKEKPSQAWADMYGGGFETAMKFLTDSEVQRAAEIKNEQDRLDREQGIARDLAVATVQLRSAKRLRVLAIALGLMCVAAVALTGFTIRESQRANSQALEAFRKTEEVKDRMREVEHQKLLAESAQKKLTSSLNVLAKVGAKNVEAAVDRQTAALLPRVYMQILDDADRPAAQIIAADLQKAGMIVLGVETVTKAAGKLRQTEVRYYKKSEEPTAKRITAVLQSAGYRDAKPVYLGLEDSTKVRANHYEVWLLHDSLNTPVSAAAHQ